jgi:radical SAM family uncharacterized protein/radical SAM-linked protein
MSDAPTRHPYAAFLAQVQKPSCYVGGEYNQVRKDPGTVRARVCLAFPDAYEIGMSHLGTKILYSLLNRTPGIACERAFAPWQDMEAELRHRRLPLLTLESASPLPAFDVVGFSLQYELNFTGVLTILDLAGLALRTADRPDEAPLILGGGPVATHPEPLAPFIDAFFIGEAEELLPSLCLEAAELRRARVPRAERLARLAARYPLYVPSLYRTERDSHTGLHTVTEPLDARVPPTVRRTWVADINRYPFPDDSPLPFSEAVFDRMAVEIARGCTEGCRFCQAGVVYRPVRERDPVAVVDALVEGIRKGGYDETSLASLWPADYSCISPLVKAATSRLRDHKVSLSVSSLRAYGLGDDLLGEMASLGMSGLTFSPEAGTQRMRDVVNKNVSEADILESAHRVFSCGHQRMKLYFMIGLPSETDEDVLGIVETTARVQEIGRRYLRGAKVTAAVSVFVPKPHTPFQWAAMDSREITAHKQVLLAEHGRRLRVAVRMHDNTQSHLGAIFARGDRSCADWLERAYRLGCRFDGWDDALRADLWERAVAEEGASSGFDPERFLGSLDPQSRLPWDHIDAGVGVDFLRSEYKRALDGRLSPPCGKSVGRLLHPSNVADALMGSRPGFLPKLVCYDCGVACDLDGIRHERLFFLRRMNAWAPVERASAPARPAAGKHRAAPRPLTRFAQAVAHRYRLRYTKQGQAAYLAHLDLVRHLPRIFRRAGLDIAYSCGFHPKPGFSFGPALGLGIPSLGELLDVKLSDDISPAELLSRLNAVSLAGIEFLAATALQESEPALGRVLARAEYAVHLPAGQSAASAVALFASGVPLLAARRERKDSRKSGSAAPVDVRPSVTDMAAARAAAAHLLCEKLGWAGATSDNVLIFGVVITALGSARPVEVVEALYGPALASQATIARLALWAAVRQDRDGCFVDPLAVEPRRPSPAGADCDHPVGQGREAGRVVPG